MVSWTKLTHRGGDTVPNPEPYRKLNPPALIKVNAWIEAWGQASREKRTELGGMPADAIIAHVLEVTLPTVRKWLHDGEIERALDTRHKGTLARELADCADEIRRLQVGQIAGTLYGIACDAEHPKVVNAAQLLLPRIDPAGWGPQAQALDVRVDTTEPEVYQIPQAVFDALTDDERAEHFADQELLAATVARIDARLSLAASRV
jgi:uncharacterized protein YndB with AHSA1/START domain